MTTWRRGARAEQRPAGDDVATRVPRRSGHRILFSRRVAVLTVVTVLLALLLAGTALAALSGPRDTTTDLHDNIAPVLDQLYKASLASRKAQERFEASLVATGVDRSTNISESQRYGNLAATYFARYKEAAIGTPAERRMIAEYEKATTASQAAGAAVFALVDSPDAAARAAAFQNQSDLAQQNTERLNDIRRRFYVSRLMDGVDDAHGQLQAAVVWILAVTAAIIAAVLSGGVYLYGVARRNERVLASQEAERQLEERRANLENQLQRGLEMEPTEESTHSIIEAAIVMVRPHEPVELLVADSSLAHFDQAFSTDKETNGPGCAVPSPNDCPAASSGQTRVFLSSARIDACPYLRGRTPDPRSAACVPVNIAGSTTGVLHTTGPEFAAPDTNDLAELELVARKAGERIGYLRVLARSEMQARIDVLTGLVNRRSLEDHARGLMERGEDFVVAFADLDHFKDLNDTYGHETGDRALRLFSRVLRETVRPADVPARYGGEEFVVLLPDMVLPDARIVTERIRERLRTVVAGTSVPPFTVSIGLTSWEPPEEFAETVVRADKAMLYAKQTGRDRVVTSIEVPADSTPFEAPPVGTSPTS